METSNVTLRRLKTFLKYLENKFALNNHTHITVNGHTVNSNVPANAKFTDTTYPISYKTIDTSFLNSFRTETKGNTATGDYISTIRSEASVDGAGAYGSGLAFGRGDTHGYLYVDYNTANAYLGGGNANLLQWHKKISFSDHAHTTVNGHTVNSDVPVNAVFTDTTYSDATTSAHGLMSPADKTKLNKIGSNVSIGSRITIASGTSISGVANNLTTTGVNFVLDARQGKALNDKIEELKKSVTDGKSAIASAITTKGVSTASDASFATMASNIKNISTGLSTSDIVELSKNCSTPNLMISSVTTIINAGYPNGSPFESSSASINAWYLMGGNNKTTRWGDYIFYNFVDHGGHDTTNSSGTFDMDMYIISSKETKSYKNVYSITLPRSESSKLAIKI